MADFPGIRPKNGGIEMRAQVNGTRYSWFLKKNWNPTNCREADRIRKANIADLKAGADHLRGDNPPFIDVSQDYLNSLRKQGYSKKHLNNVKNEINRRWGPYLGEMGIGDIRVRHCREADDDIEWSSEKRQQNARSILRQVFEFAIQDELIDDNPAAKLRSVSHQRPEIDPFNEKERDAILQALAGEPYRYFKFAFETGMRPAELLGLDRADIRGNKAHLHQTLVGKDIKKMKIKKVRTVLLSPGAIEAIACDITPLSGRVFPLPHEDYCESWNEALEAAGVRYRRPYTTRHTRASIGLLKGQTPAWLAKQLGHDLRTFFERYAQWIDGDMDDQEMAKWAASTEVGIERGQKTHESN